MMAPFCQNKSFRTRTYSECVQGLPPGDKMTGELGESVLLTQFKTFRYTELNNCVSLSASARLSPKKKKPLKKQIKEVVKRLQNFPDDLQDFFLVDDIKVSNCMELQIY